MQAQTVLGIGLSVEEPSHMETSPVRGINSEQGNKYITRLLTIISAVKKKQPKWVHLTDRCEAKVTLVA